MIRLSSLLALATAALLPGGLWAAESVPVSGHAVSGQIITAEEGVAPNVSTSSGGLALTLEDGWKTYWRSPGEVGLPPELIWDGSENIASVDLSYPAPSRFDAFDIQNFGYAEEVVYPLAIQLTEPGAPALLNLQANVLVCADVCIPETLNLTLDLQPGGGIDMTSADRLAEWIARVPATMGEADITLDQVHLDDTALTVTARSDAPFGDVDLFPEHGDYGAFDAPDIRLSDDGRALWARIPVVSPGEGALDITLVDGDRAVTLPALPGDVLPAPPSGGANLWSMLLIAFLGGVILNAMPCVLPVLSLKLAGALQAVDRPLTRVRSGFLASAAGVLSFFAVLAAGVIALRSAGVAVGWGVQFQQPVFLALMIGLIALFSANMLGLFSVSVGSRAMTGLARSQTKDGWGGDFATGAFAAVMATPCSAPFIGTAVTFALTNGPVEIIAIFLAMGVGLALPYLLVAAFPAVVRRLPRPGLWMVWVQRALGVVLLLTAAWLVTVLASAADWTLAFTVSGLSILMLAGLAFRLNPGAIGLAGVSTVVAAALLMPTVAPPSADPAAGWAHWNVDQAMAEVAAGNVVFVDVTADWCLTCKANKRLVLDRDEVRSALDTVVAMQADWTRPSDEIAAYLQSNDRFGIPFNQVYGPGAPEGIVLPELLTEAVVMDALDRAAGL